MGKLLDAYIHLLELEKKKAETLEKIIYSIIWHKVEGGDHEKRTLIETIKRIDCLNKPGELRKLIDSVLDGEPVKAYDIYRECVLGYKKFRFSAEFRKSLKKVLY